MESTSFNLLDEPWIRVRTRDGDLAELSLSAVVAEAHTLRDLAGEIPTQDAAILRLLEAVLLGALRTEERTEDEALDTWNALWSRGRFDSALVAPYLEAVRARFDLLHPQTPFFQVAGLTTASGNRSGLTKLIAEVPDGHQFFTTRAGADLDSLSLAEAARWLVHCQAFDPSGIKSGAVGDERVKGGKGYPFGYPAWSGNLGLVIAQGSTLFETLLLNLPLTMSGPEDLPAWERQPNGPGADALHPAPHGPADLFTWPSRRLRLFTEGDRVVDVQVSNGDRLPPQNLHPFEPMCAWRYSKAQSKKGQHVLMPVMHDPSRRIWQGLGPLLHRHLDPSDGKQPAVLEWVATLCEAAILPEDYSVALRIIGAEYGPQNSTIADVVDDRLAASVVALTDPVLAQSALTAAELAKGGVVALANLAGNLDRASGGEGNAREATFELGYHRLDGLYRAWLSTLHDPERSLDYLEDWSSRARAVLRRAGDDLVSQAGQLALVGRTVTLQNRTVLLDAGLAQRWFHLALAKTFPSVPSVDQETA